MVDFRYVCLPKMIKVSVDYRLGTWLQLYNNILYDSVYLLGP